MSKRPSKTDEAKAAILRLFREQPETTIDAYRMRKAVVGPITTQAFYRAWSQLNCRVFYWTGRRYELREPQQGAPCGKVE
jgi:hypothetical protein